MANSALTLDGKDSRTKVIANFTSSGSIGTAATTVDVADVIVMNQTTFTLTFTVPNPTTVATKRRWTFVNGGTASFTLFGRNVGPGEVLVVIWTGTGYRLVAEPARTLPTIPNLIATTSEAWFGAVTLSATGRVYRWDPTATLNHNADTVINPTANTGVGRFLLCFEPNPLRSEIHISTGSSATITTFGAVNAITGTGTSRVSASTSYATRMRRTGLVSAATAAAITSVRSSGATWSMDEGFKFTCAFVVSDAATVATSNMFIGLSPSTAAPTNASPQNVGNSIGLMQNAGGNLTVVAVSGGVVPGLFTDLGTLFPAGTSTADAYYFRLYVPPNATPSLIGYHVERINTGDVATGVYGTAPDTAASGGGLLSPKAWRSNNATLLAVGLDIGFMRVDSA
jgi:hypothetical protein